MAKYILCDNCKKLVEYCVDSRMEYGITYTTLKCPECGYTKESSTINVSPMFLEGRK